MFYVLVFLASGMWDLSSLTRDNFHPCIGRQSFNQWITREVTVLQFLKLNKNHSCELQINWFFQTVKILMNFLGENLINPNNVRSSQASFFNRQVYFRGENSFCQNSKRKKFLSRTKLSKFTLNKYKESFRKKERIKLSTNFNNILRKNMKSNGHGDVWVSSTSPRPAIQRTQVKRNLPKLCIPPEKVWSQENSV